GGPARGGRRAGQRLLRLLLGPEVGDRALDRVLGEHRAVDLHRREVERLGDYAVLDRLRLVDRLGLQPLRGERRRRDGRPAAERLELRVLDAAALAALDLHAHGVAAGRSVDERRADAVVVLLERPDVLRALVVLDDLVAVCHGSYLVRSLLLLKP